MFEKARAFLENAYEKIKHGDEAHQVWLRDALLKLAPALGQEMSRFAIGDKQWPGISKLIEEAGEVLRICGKLMGARGERVHWNVPDLKAELEDEIADLTAACAFVIGTCGLDKNRILARYQEKLIRFHKWHKLGDDCRPGMPEPE